MPMLPHLKGSDDPDQENDAVINAALNPVDSRVFCALGYAG